MLCIFNEFLVHDSRSYERFLVVVAVARAKLEKSTPKCDPDPCLWDAGAVLYKLSNPANWELVVMWVHHFSQRSYVNISDLFYSSYTF